MAKQVAVLPGDGIGPEVMKHALRVLNAVAEKKGHEFTFLDGLVGGAAYDEFGEHFPAPTRELCEKADAILFGSVGGPVNEQHLDKWKGCEANSILSIRKAFNFHANFRPAKVYPELIDICPLKKEVAAGVDLLIVRELVGDLYFGLHETKQENGERVAVDVATYTESQIRAVSHAAFQAAQKRGKRLMSVDKANVLDTSKLWRAVVTEVSAEYPDVDLEHMLVDNCAMQLIRAPGQFDVVVTSNMFGDILSDAAAVLPGSLGLLASASVNEDGFFLYEPSGGSAPDIAGKGIANPIAQILCVAMMYRFSFGLTEEATAIENAVDTVLAQGFRTKDIYANGDTLCTTSEITDAIIERIEL